MKRLLYIFTIAAAFIAYSAVSLAQTPSPQNVFTTKINDYEVGVKRNIPTVTQQSFNAAMTMINDEINSLTQQIQNTTNTTLIATLTAKKSAEQQIYNDLQALQSNLVTNFNQIKAKMQDFVSMM